MKNILIVIDMQNDFITGSLGSKEAQEIVPLVANRIKEGEANGEIIIFTKDTHGNNYLETREGKYLPVKHCVVDTPGWELAPEIRECVNDLSMVLNKTRFSAAGGDITWERIIDAAMRTVSAQENETLGTIELCGLCTDICVISNAIALRDAFQDATIQVNSKLCAGVTPELHKSALDVMKSCQIEIL